MPKGTSDAVRCVRFQKKNDVMPMWQTAPRRHRATKKDKEGTVILKGSVKSGSGGSAIFNLPAGYRPLLRLYFACQDNGVSMPVSVRSNGNVVCDAAVVATKLSLGGVRFRAEQ